MPLKRHIIETRDDNPGLIETSAVGPASSGLKEEWCINTWDDGLASYAVVFTARGAPFYIAQVQGVVAQARGVR
jgi:hypothetical protein